MKKIKYVCAALVMLLIGVISATGCNYDVKNPVIFSDVTEIYFSIYMHDNNTTFVTDKEDRDEIVSLLSAVPYKEGSYEEKEGDIGKALPIFFEGEDFGGYIFVYSEGFARVTVQNPEDGSYKYYISEYGIDYDGVLELLKELREEERQEKNAGVLQNIEEMTFQIYMHDSNMTFVTDKEDRDEIVSLLSAVPYKEGSYEEKEGDIGKALPIFFEREDFGGYIFVYSEGFARVTVQNPEDGSYKYYISEYGIDYDGVLELLKELRREWRESIKS